MEYTQEQKKSAKLGCKCKHCKANAAFRSHRRNFLEFWRTRLTGKVPFHCTKCNRRYWDVIDPVDI